MIGLAITASPYEAFAQSQNNLQLQSPVTTATIPTSPTQSFNNNLPTTPLITTPPVHGYNIWSFPPGYWGPIVSCTGNYPIGSGSSAITSNNPSGKPNCTNLDDLIQTFVNAIYLLMSVALFAIAPILFIVGGLMMIASGGNPERITQARKTMIGAVIGVVIVLCAYLIVNTVIVLFHISGISGFSG
jgi:hypothetical protein